MRRGTWWAFEAFLQLAPGQMRCIEDRRWRARGTTKTLLELPPGLTQRSGCLRFGGLFRMKHFVESHDAVPLRFVFGQLRTSQMQTDRVWYGQSALLWKGTRGSLITGDWSLVVTDLVIVHESEHLRSKAREVIRRIFGCLGAPRPPQIIIELSASTSQPTK